MHAQYTDTIAGISSWARSEPGIQGVVIIGSQARYELPADCWSDLDLMVLVEDPRPLLDESGWLGVIGALVCWFDEIVPLPGFAWNWCVKRALYEDGRDVDFSILPYCHLDEVLAVNQDILARGWRVLYEACPGELEQKIRALPGQGERRTAGTLGEEEISRLVSDLLFHVVWAMKKIRRGELWVATGCINSYMRDLLLRLIEAHNVATGARPDVLRYNGRFLEQRTAPSVLASLSGCMTRYDSAEAVETLGHLLDLISGLAHSIETASGFQLDPRPFEQVRGLYERLKAG